MQHLVELEIAEAELPDDVIRAAVLDLRREESGLLKLTGRSPGLRDGIRQYFLQRNDDANTLA